MKIIGGFVPQGSSLVADFERRTVEQNDDPLSRQWIIVTYAENAENLVNGHQRGQTEMLGELAITFIIWSDYTGAAKTRS